METKDNNITSNSEESGMGNEVSHSEGVKQSVGGEGHTGQFHKVFVEPEVSHGSDDITTDELSSAGIHNEATLQIRRSHTDTVAGRADRSYEEQELIEKCKALITEAAGRVEKQSLARPSFNDHLTEQITDLDDIAPDEDGDDVFEVIQVNKDGKVVNDLGDKDKNNSVGLKDKQTNSIFGPGKYQSKSCGNTPVKSKNKADNKKYAVKCGIVTDNSIFYDDIAVDSEKKVKHQSSDQSPASSSSHGSPDKSVVKNSPKKNPLAKMFKFSRRKPKAEADVSSETNGKKIDGIVEENIGDDSNNTLDNDKIGIGESSGNTSEDGTPIKRLNSLDSGIVVDKVTSGVEYAVVQKKKTKGLVPVKKVEAPKKADNENEISKPSEDTKQDNGKITEDKSEPLYMNGTKDNQDFVYINERAIDVSGLPDKILDSLPGGKEDNVGSDVASERSGTEAEVQSIVSSDSAASSGAKYKVSDKTKPEKPKLKKKSWSFQVMGKKDKRGSNEDEIETDSNKVSMDPSASPPPETKKSKWLFGMFSFRRGSDDMTSSTPNLQQVGIPEEQEVDGGQVKSRTKLKKKGKDKKSKSPKKDVTSLDKRSTSLMDIVPRDSNNSRKRRSIIEDDIEYTPTDAFEGVTLSDLSQDEEAETEVTMQPDGNSKNVKEKHGKKEKQGKVKTPVETEVQKVQEVEKVEDESFTGIKGVSLDSVDVGEANKSIDASVDDNKLTSEIIEDEYVSIVPDKHDEIERIEINEDEYAVVTKKKPEAKKDIDKSKSSDTVTDEENDTALLKEYGLEQSQLTENDREVTEDVMVPVQNEKAFSNLIYSDEEFNASLIKISAKAGKTAIKNKDEEIVTVTPTAEASKEVVEEYVEVKSEIAELQAEPVTSQEESATENEIKEKTEELKAEPSENDGDVSDTVISKEEVTVVESAITQSEIKQDDIEPVVQTEEESCAPKVEPEAEILPEVERTVTTEVKTIVLKDVGVQAPDIHMPLDINVDFGNTTGKVTTVSIGVQVDGNELDDVNHVVVTMETNKEIQKPSEA